MKNVQIEQIDKMSNLEKREIKLEAIIQCLYTLIEDFNESTPFPTGNLTDLSMHLYNEAEIRVDIDDWFSVDVEMNDINKEEG